MPKVAKYIITLAKKFPGTHPKKGTPTGFKEKYLTGEKIHTIRRNYQFWESRLRKINQGKGILCIKEWSGRPYNSPQTEIDILEKVGFQKFDLFHHKGDSEVFQFLDLRIDGSPRYIPDISGFEDIAENDGFGDNTEDFLSWFPKDVDNGIIIHFTDLMY